MADTLLREGIAFQSQPLSPVPQYWTGTAYEKVQGANGASRTIIYDASGAALLTAVNPGKVDIQSSLPAGTNNIGDVDVLTLPELPAGTNNIGDVDIVTVPVVGVYANAWDNVAVGIGGTSTAIDCQYQYRISVFGTTSAATTITANVSQDGTNYYDSGNEQVLAGAGDFHFSFETGARYVQLISSAAATITATIAGK